MEKLVKMVGRFMGMDVNAMIEDSFKTPAVIAEVKRLNNEQLDQGIDAKGKQMRTYKAKYPDVYAKYTIKKKQEKGQPYNRVTLKDTGKFREGLKVKSYPGHASILGDTNKPKGDMMDNIDVNEALGVTDENKSELIQVLRPVLHKAIRNEILKS